MEGSTEERMDGWRSGIRIRLVIVSNDLKVTSSPFLQRKRAAELTPRVCLPSPDFDVRHLFNSR